MSSMTQVNLATQEVERLNSTQRLPLDLHHCLNRCGITRIGKGYCYACMRLYAPVALHVVPDPHPNELAGRAPAAAEPSARSGEGAKRLWDTLPRVRVGVASHLPFRPFRVRRGKRAASHRIVVELKAFVVCVFFGLVALFCCMALLRACQTIYAIDLLSK